MDELKVFAYGENEVRTIEKDGEIWWVLTDVCEILGLSNPTVVADRLDYDERAKFDLGRQGETNIVNEAGLYKVIFRSEKAEAKKFTRWVTHEVLPSIRKTGGYIAHDERDSMVKAVTAAVMGQLPAVVAETVKAALNVTHGGEEPPTTEAAALNLYLNRYRRGITGKTKLETFPDEIVEQVDVMLEKMLLDQKLNFRKIERFCKASGYPITSVSVKKYFVRDFINSD